MTRDDPNELMGVSSGMAITVASFDSLAVVLIVCSPLLRVGFSYYKWSWTLWVALSVCVGLLTYKLSANRPPARSNMFRAAFLLVPAVIIMLFFEPRDSHWDSVLIAAAYGSLVMMTIGCRQAGEVYAYLDNPKLTFEGRLERLKATVSLWQQISIYSMAAYMGFVAVALGVFWAANTEKLKINPSLGWHFVYQMAIYSVCVSIGPLHECFEMMFKAGRQLSAIKKFEEHPKESSRRGLG